jgi:hypothetical protein
MIKFEQDHYFLFPETIFKVGPNIGQTLPQKNILTVRTFHSVIQTKFLGFLEKLSL